MRAFLQGGLKKDWDVALEFYTNAIEVIEWGQTVWKDASREERGTIFDRTFVRGVRRLRLEAFMQVENDVACGLRPVVADRIFRLTAIKSRPILPP